MPCRLLIDTGSELTWIAAEALLDIGVTAGRITTDEVVFALEGDLQLLGARTLEGLNLAVDPARKRLVAAGPLPAAACPTG